MNFQAAQQIIENAVRNEKTILIKYLDDSRIQSQRQVKPLEILEDGRFRAFCYLRDEERTFSIRNILAINGEKVQENQRPRNNNPHNQVQNGEVSLEAAPVVRRTAHRQVSYQKPFVSMKTEQEWERMIQYYEACLRYEYQQKFSFEASQLVTTSFPQDQIYQFLDHAIDLKYAIPQVGFSEKIKRFFDENKHRREQLCMGSGFVKIRGKLSPLLFSSINLERFRDHFLLRSDETGFSYAAFINIKMQDEEISDLIDEYDQKQLEFESWKNHEEFLIEYLQHTVTSELPVYHPDQIQIDDLPDYSIWMGNGLFWASSLFTGSLMEELSTLRTTGSFRKNPQVIDFLFNHQPNQEYPAAPEFLDDDAFYITEVNDTQRQAARVVQNRPLTVVTGPPGTGKSQLILNLVAQAILAGKSVLFCSQNNKAVNVVMDRLRGEIDFPGAVRTGNNTYRKTAVPQMRAAMGLIRDEDLNQYQEQTNKAKNRLVEVNAQLEKIRDLLGVMDSAKYEANEIEETIPPALLEDIKKSHIPFDALQRDLILGECIDIRQRVWSLQEDFDRLLEKYLRIINNDDKYDLVSFFLDNPALGACLEEDRFWNQSPEHPDKLISVLDNWIHLIDAISLKSVVDDDRSALFRIENELNKLGKKDARIISKAQSILGVEMDKSTLMHKLNQWENFNSYLIDIQEKNISFFEKLLLFLGIKSPARMLDKLLESAQELNPLIKEDEISKSSLSEMIESSSLIADIYNYSYLLQSKEKTRTALEQSESEYELFIQSKSINIEPEINKYSLSAIQNEHFTKNLKELKESILVFRERYFCSIDHFKDRIHFMVISSPYLDMVWKGAANKTTELVPERQIAVSDYGKQVDTWKQIIKYWQPLSTVIEYEKLVAQLPDENSALQELIESQDALYVAYGKLLRASWSSQASMLDQETLRNAMDYIDTVDQLNNLDYHSNPGLYRELKSRERDMFPSAKKVFPVWAITNLTARTNFPLEPELFDMLVIDEASQCNIPAAIPLVFRSKQLVVIGDPNQLKHVASIDIKLDVNASKNFGVPERLSYSTKSFYDLAEYSLTEPQKPILLNHHYRSDSRIIQFSNQEFYNNDLIIETDLTRRGLEKDFLRLSSGVYWIDVEGNCRRNNAGGSSYNMEELKSLQQFLPTLMERLNREAGRQLSFGIVTPFRQQENRIQKLLDALNLGMVQSGTAHQFQGDECDFMFFLPVLSKGIYQGTLKWLERTYHLLNVAITRARIGLIILGDHTYCLSLPKENKYRRLAQYVNDELNAVYQNINQIPLFRADTFDIIGELINPLDRMHNRMTFKRYIRTCKDYLYWLDSYFDRDVLELIKDVFLTDNSVPDIREIRLITATERLDEDARNHLIPGHIQFLKNKLEEKGIAFELRFLERDKLPHDRFLYSQNRSVNMPPFANVYGTHTRMSEYTRSAHAKSEIFDPLWDKARENIY